MELALSLGDTPKPYTFNEKSQEKMKMVNKENLGFCMAIGKEGTNNENTTSKESSRGSSDPPPLQLHLLPFSPLPTNQTPSHSHHLSFSWLTHNLVVEPGSSNGGGGGGSGKRLQEVNRLSIGGAMEKAGEDGSGTALSSPNSTTSSFQMEFSMYKSGRSNKRGASEFEGDNTDRVSDEEDNGLARKKLRLTKQQSAFLEQNFKEHNTLNPKQKLALAKQLNLRPRQVEVWFQNRRARTKLKQTEVDCEYLKRCCETLTEENRKLQKEVQELRAFKSSKPFYMQLPPTTLTMCPSCERVASTTTNASAPPPGGTTTTTDTTLSLAKPEPVSPPPAQVHAPTRLPRD